MNRQYQKVNILDIPITICRLNDVEEIIAEAINKKESTSIATPNLNHLRLSTESSEFKNILLSFNHCFADGWPILYFAKKLQKVILPERVTGSDLTPLICHWASHRNWKLGFVGSNSKVKQALKEILPLEFNLTNVRHWIPEYSDLNQLHDPKLVEEIKNEKIDVLLVALGPYKQEKWIFENQKESNAMIAIGVGASLAFLAKETSRAPTIFQKLKFEFLYRILADPIRLLPRYLKDLIYFCKIFMTKKKV